MTDIIYTLLVELTEEEVNTMRGMLEYHSRNAREEMPHCTSSEADTFAKEIKLCEKLEQALD